MNDMSLQHRPARAANEERMAELILPHQTNGYGTMLAVM
jgi:hypothetical protein